jgi:hypothetical protein
VERGQKDLWLPETERAGETRLEIKGSRRMNRVYKFTQSKDVFILQTKGALPLVQN